MGIPEPPAIAASPDASAAAAFSVPGIDTRQAFRTSTVHTLTIAWSLARRDIKSRYARSQLGAILTLLQPVLWLTTAVLAFWFLMRAGADRSVTASWTHYAARTAAALAAWLPLAEAWGRAPSGFQAQAPLIRRTRFPFLSIPLALAAAALVTGGISFALALCLTPWAGPVQGLSLLQFALPGLALTALWTMAGALVLSAVGVFFRDLTSLIGHLLTLGMLVTPIYYDPAIVPAAYRWAVLLNPLATPASLLRCAVGGTVDPALPLCAVYSGALGALVFWLGLALHARLRARIPEQL